MRSMVLVALVGATLLVTMAASLVPWQGSDRSARAAPNIVIGFDMNTAGNTCPGTGTTDCTLGTIDACVQVPSDGGSIEFDVFVKDLPAFSSEPYEDLNTIQYYVWEKNYELNGGQTVGTVTAFTNANALINLIYQVPPLASLTEFSAQPPYPLVGWFAIVNDLTGGVEVFPQGGPFTQGVLTRLNVTIPPETPDGVYGLTIVTPDIGGSLPIIAGTGGDNLCGPDDDLYPGVPDHYTGGCDTLDAYDGYGLIAVGVDCSAGPPVITPTPTPTSSITPTPTSTPITPTPGTPTPPATPTPIPPDLVAGWNYACYLGPALPVPDALAHIMPGVQALYHLRADQGYDKWFPARPELSTMTDVSPYEPLFILMANDSDWPQTPADTPPTGLDLAPGWNSACYSGQTKDASSATGGITGQYEALYLLAPSQGWKRFIPARPEISNLDQLQQFAAVLVLVTQPEGARWVFDP